MEAQSNKPLSVAILRARNGDVAGFEDFYLLTCANAFRDIRSFSKGEEESWQILRELYQEIWRRHESLPESGIIRSWIRIIIRDVSKRFGCDFVEDFSGVDSSLPIPDLENQMVVSLIFIEEQLGITPMPKAISKKGKSAGGFLTGGRFFFSLILLFVSVFLAFFLFQNAKEELKFKEKKAEESGEIKTLNVNLESEEETKELKTGWNDSDLGRMYRNEDGTFRTSGWFEDGNQLFYMNDEGYALTGRHQFKAQNYTFGDDGALKEISGTYGRENKETILSRHMRERGQDESIEKIIKNSIVLDNEWIYFLRAEEGSVYPSLCRVLREEDRTEVIAEAVSGYCLQNKYLWFCKDGKMEFFDKSQSVSETEQSFKTDNETNPETEAYVTGPPGVS